MAGGYGLPIANFGPRGADITPWKMQQDAAMARAGMALRQQESAYNQDQNQAVQNWQAMQEDRRRFEADRDFMFRKNQADRVFERQAQTQKAKPFSRQDWIAGGMSNVRSALEAKTSERSKIEGKVKELAAALDSMRGDDGGVDRITRAFGSVGLTDYNAMLPQWHADYDNQDKEAAISETITNWAWDAAAAEIGDTIAEREERSIAIEKRARELEKSKGEELKAALSSLDAKVESDNRRRGFAEGELQKAQKELEDYDTSSDFRLLNELVEQGGSDEPIARRNDLIATLESERTQEINSLMTDVEPFTTEPGTEDRREEVKTRAAAQRKRMEEINKNYSEKIAKLRREATELRRLDVKYSTEAMQGWSKPQQSAEKRSMKRGG